MSIVNFAHLSLRNQKYPMQSVTVANGVTFLALVMSEEEKRQAANIIYMHVQRENRKCYIGITIMRAADRWGAGIAYRNNRRFSRAIQKYGWNIFDSYILAFGEDRKSLNIAEVVAIAAAGGHKSKFTYNLSPGGDMVSENDKPIVGVHLPTGETRQFKSGSDATRKLGINNTDMPMAVARGERSSVGEWWFRFKDDMLSQPPSVWGEDLRITSVRELQGKIVIAINTVTGEERRFETISDAARETGAEKSAVSGVARGAMLSAHGWWFKFEGDNRQMPATFGSQATREKRDRRIYAINLITGEKRSFRNSTVADSELGIFRGAAASVARGERMSAADWSFSFDETAPPPAEFKGALVAKARSKPVIAIHLTTGSEQKYSSAKAAAAELGISRAAISKAIKGELKAVKGFCFRFA